MEKFQAARYGVNGEYVLHTDTLDTFNDLEVGGRWGTLILYLNDVEEGGETEFPYANGGEGVVVEPKVGRGLFFHNVKEGDFPITDEGIYGLRTEEGKAHRGRRVGGGRKYILTLWMHAVDVKGEGG